MPRLYLIILLALSSFSVSGQDLLKKYIDFAEKQYAKGDYYYAVDYYQKAMDLDSQSVAIVWGYAKTLFAYKDYRKAEYYFEKVYKKEAAEIYPESILYLGITQKHNGKYEAATQTFKKAKKKYLKDRKGYLYQKARREIASCLWAKSAIKDTADVIFEQLPETVNTKNSEFGHTIIDNQLIISSLRADSISEAEEVYEEHYSTLLYTSKLNDSTFEEAERIEQLVFENMNTGNGSLSLDGNRYYFSLCNNDGYNYRCKIMVAHYENGKWTNIDSLGSIINEPGANTTMPHIGEVNGQEMLFFASDREDSKGGLDIYYAKIKNGNQYEKVKNIKAVNSLDNELTPYWSKEEQRLYFSSSWHDGFGGYDIYYSSYNNTFGQPMNIGQPFNSSANDLYYFKHKDTSYITSNRIGVFFSKNPTCCSDIFIAHPPIKITPPTQEETLADLNKRLPVTLYFHNDIPNPRSWDTTTNVNYIESYNDYHAMIAQYKKEYSKGLKGQKADEAKEDIESFFIEYVDQGVKDLELFRDLLLDELNKGSQIKITIQGFASPLAKTNYNVHLTKRRIQSLINYLRHYENGVFVPYLDKNAENGGYVIFEQVPFGEYSANQLTSDNPNDVQNSVYSRAAAIERKIEIQSVSFIQDTISLPIKIDQPVKDLGDQKPGVKLTHTFTLENTSDTPLEIESIEVECECNTYELSQSNIPANGKVPITMHFDTKDYHGHTVKSIYVKIKDFDEKIRLIMTTELK